MFKKVLTLKFEEVPPYDEIIQLMIQHICQEVRIGPDLQPIMHEFEWSKNCASKFKQNYIKENNLFDSNQSMEFFRKIAARSQLIGNININQSVFMRNVFGQVNQSRSSSLSNSSGNLQNFVSNLGGNNLSNDKISLCKRWSD
jgi:hypothetical protein